MTTNKKKLLTLVTDEAECGPTTAELELLAAETPIIDAQVELLDVEISLIDRAPTELDMQRVRRAHRMVIAALLAAARARRTCPVGGAA